MSNKMKGLLKGLRYISQIFEDEEEPEMQIGEPTDVKHVAHIGWDGPTANAPSWIQNFKEGDSAGGAPQNVDTQNVPRSRDPRLPAQEKRNSTGSDSTSLEPSPSRRRSDKAKGARRHNSAGTSTDSPRRSSNSSKVSSGPTSPTREPTSSSKTSRRKKTKGSSKSKSTAPPQSNLAYSDPGSACGNVKDSCQSSVLVGSDSDQKALDDNIRRIHAM